MLQGIIERAPHAPRYFFDAALVYGELSYWGTHTSMYNKSKTYSVEAVNADLRHYLSGASGQTFTLLEPVHPCAQACGGLVRALLQRTSTS